MHFSGALGTAALFVLGFGLVQTFIAYFLARTDLRSFGQCSRVYLWCYIASIGVAWLATLAAGYVAIGQDSRPEVGLVLYESNILFWLCVAWRIVRTVRTQLFLTSKRTSWQVANLKRLINCLLWYSQDQMLILQLSADGLEVAIDGKFIRCLPATVLESKAALKELRNSRAYRFVQMRPSRAQRNPATPPTRIRVFYDQGKPVMESTYE